jgi:hypothetical protein
MLLYSLNKDNQGGFYMNEMEQKIADYITDVQPNDAKTHVTAYAFCKVMYGATQKSYVEVAGFSDRLLRKYISQEKELYEEELQRLTEVKEYESPSPDFAKMSSRIITEEMLDSFIDSLFKSAVNGNAREKELFLSFTGLTAEDVLTLNKTKAKSLRYWIRERLADISSYMDTKTLGLMTETSELIFRGNKETANNAQNFVNKSIEDEAFKLELMYWGAVHLSMMNNVAHPDLELLATAVRLDKMLKGSPETYNKYEVKKYAKGESIVDKAKAPVDEAKLEAMLAEILGDKEQAQDVMYASRMAKDIVKTPKVVRANVEQRATEYEEQLRVLLTAEENVRHMMREITRKVNKNN